MNDVLLILIFLFSAGTFALLLLRTLKGTKVDLGGITDEIRRLEPSFRDETARIREEISRTQQANRQELFSLITKMGESQNALFNQTMKEFGLNQKTQYDGLLASSEKLTAKTEERVRELKQEVERRLESIQRDNNERLKEMRDTVDEKLQSTLEKRLNESFTQVSERLEQVHQGLGQMQTLAEGVGDLKKVLSNARSRGVLGEIQLESILENSLASNQYRKNVRIKTDTQEVVEFAIVFPGKDGDEVLLPIDSKFPLESYERLIEAYESMDRASIEKAQKEIATKFRTKAQEIQKYLEPGMTTDFAIMFLPLESLYAELTRNHVLFTELQKDFQVIACGPNTLSALINSIRIGFRTLAIEKQTSQIRDVLRAVKTEFKTFGSVLANARKKIDSAGTDLDNLIGARTRKIEKRLNGLETMSLSEATTMIDDGTGGDSS